MIYESRDIIPKEIKNRFLKRNIKKSDLTQQELEILKCLNKPKDAYYCGYCPSFPLISFSLDKDPRKASFENKRKMVTVTLLEHNWGKNKLTQNISHKFRDDELRSAFHIYSRNYIQSKYLQYLIKDKYIEDISDDLLPFESKEDFDEFLKVVIKYKILKEKIAFYNDGDTTRNYVFTFLEFILNLGLYGFGTLYEFLNALSISEFLEFKILEQYNCGYHMNNKDLIYELKKFDLKQVTNIIKLNDEYLFAFIIDVTYKFSSYPNNIVGIFIETLDTKSYFNSSISYLNYKETDKQKKNVIIKYGNNNYKNIIELETEKYLLQVDNEYLSHNLLVASYNGEFKKYDFIIFNNCIGLAFLKLKSNKFFMVGKNILYVLIYIFGELKILKEINIEITPNSNCNYLCNELLNEDILFNLAPNKLCYFNIKTFTIQTIIEITKNEIINRFNQLNNKNIFYFFTNNFCYEFNLMDGGKKEIPFSKINNEDSTVMNEYYINASSKSLIIKNQDSELLYEKRLNTKGRILIINEKENIFAILSFCDTNYSMNVNYFKINKNK